MVKKNWSLKTSSDNWKRFTNDQILACIEFSQLLNDTSLTALFVRLGEVEVQNTTPKELAHIFSCFNRLFFPGANTYFEVELFTETNL
jgi:hypothetical protein